MLRIHPSALAAVAAGAAIGLALWGFRPAPAPQEAPAHADFSDRNGGSEAPAPKAAASAERPAPRPRLEHRLDDAEWRLVEGLASGPDQRLAPRLSMIGGTETAMEPSFVLVRPVFPPSLAIPEESRSECAGRLYVGGIGEPGSAFRHAGGLVVTAAHCLLDPRERWRWLEITVQPHGRSGNGRAVYRIHQAAVARDYQEDGAGALQGDLGLVFLPDDPGGGEILPQTAQVQMEPGETLTFLGMNFGASEPWAQPLLKCEQTIVSAHFARIEAKGDVCRFERGQSGGSAGRIVGGRLVQTSVISGYEADDPTRQSYAPLRPDRIRKAASAWGGMAR